MSVKRKSAFANISAIALISPHASPHIFLLAWTLPGSPHHNSLNPRPWNCRKDFPTSANERRTHHWFPCCNLFMGCAGCPLVMTIIHYLVSIHFNSFLCLPCVPDSSYLVATSRYMSHMTSKSILATARSVISAALTILATICLQPRFRLLSVSQKSRKAVSAQSNGKERHDTDEIAEAWHSDEIYRYLSQRHLQSGERQMTASWAKDWVGLWIENRQKNML